MAKPQRKPITSGRGSVSTPIPHGYVALDRLLAETGIDKVTLNNLRRYRYLIPRPLVVPLATGRRTAAFYRPETVAIIRRLQELRRETRDSDEWLWRLWLEGQPVYIREWASERLNAKANEFNKGYPPSGKVLTSAVKKVAGSLDGRIRNTECLDDPVDWLVSVAGGKRDAARDLETQPWIFDTLCKAFGFPSLGGPLRARLVTLLVRFAELLSLPRLTKIAAEATDEEIEQARRDWWTIFRIAAAAAEVDWNAVLPPIDAEIAKLDGVKRAPQSWAARKAQRTRALPPPAPVKRLLEGLREFDLRAEAFFILIGARRDPGVSAIITQVLALAELAAPQLPKRNPAPDHKPVAV